MGVFFVIQPKIITLYDEYDLLKIVSRYVFL